MGENPEYQDYDFYGYDCEMCHNAPIDRSENPNSRLCKSCREKAIHYPVPKKIWIAAVVVLVLMIGAMVRFPRILKEYKVYAMAESRIHQGELYETMDDFLELVDQHPESVKLSGRLVTLAMEYGCYDYAAYTMDTYLAGKEVSDSLYRKLDSSMETLECYYGTMEAIRLLSEEIDETLPPEQITAELKEACLNLVGDEGQYPALLYFYASMFAQDSEEQRTYLEQCLSLDPMIAEADVILGTHKRREGDFEGAGTCYERVLSLNKRNPSALRARGILRMLEGDMEQGMADIASAYEIYPDTTYLRETYMIALALAGDDLGSRKLRQEILDQGEVIERDTEMVMSGEMSLHAYYVENKEGE